MNLGLNLDQVLERVRTLPTFARCRVCGQTWDTDATVVVEEQGEEVDLTQFVGRPLAHALALLRQRGAQGGVLYELLDYIRRPHETKDQTVPWGYTIQAGDTGLALVTTFTHSECRENLSQE